MRYDVDTDLYEGPLPLLVELAKLNLVDVFLIKLVDLTKRYLQHVVISGIVGYSKPHPEIFRIALRLAGIEPSQAIHVGDLYESDIVGARNAGIQGVLIDREGTASNLDCPRIMNLGDIYRYFT